MISPNVSLDRHRRLLAIGFLVALSLFSALPVNAADGQVLNSDGNVASDIFDSGTHAKATFDTGSVQNDCPNGLQTCVLEYRWRSRKNCLICWWSTDSNWLTLPKNATQVTHCKADGNFQFDLQVRLRWLAPQTQTVETWGRNEYRFEVGANTRVTRLLPSAVFNLSTNSGYRDHTKIVTTTAKSFYSDPYTIATSGSTYISTDC